MGDLKFYLIIRNDEIDYDEYRAAVVIAESPEDVLLQIKENNDPCTWGAFRNWIGLDVTIEELKLERGIVLGDYLSG